VDYHKYIREDDVKRGLEMLFSCLRDYYDRLDEAEVSRVLKEVERQKKDTFELYARDKKDKDEDESMSDLSSARDGDGANN
jgi:hypothetical protein